MHTLATSSSTSRIEFAAAARRATMTMSTWSTAHDHVIRRARCSTYIDDHIIIADYILDTLKDIARACNILLAAESARTPAAAGR